MRVVFKTSYDQDIRLFRHGGDVFWYGLLLLAPLLLDTFYLGELSLICIYAIAGLGLMLLVGYTGLVSLGHAAFLAIGAYAHAYLIGLGWPFLLALSVATLISATAGLLIALPTSRMTGIYLAIATLAFAIIVEQLAINLRPITGGFQGMAVDHPVLFGVTLSEPWQFYYLCLAVLILVLLGCANLLRALMAIRDSEISAQSMGIPLAHYKAIAFALSAGITGLAGGLFAHKISYLAPDAFNIILSVQLLLMVVVGGLGSLHGAIYGAMFIGFLPQALALLRDHLPSGVASTPGLEAGIFGLILMLFIIFEPQGLYGRWRKVKLYFDLFPLYRKATFRRQKAFLKTERLQ